MKTLANPRDKEWILQRLARLSAGQPPLWGRMSAHQMLCHLNDSYLVPLGQRKASPAGGVLDRVLVKWVALYLPFPWPHGYPTRPEMDQSAGGTPPQEFERDRSELVAVIKRFSALQDFAWHPHPMFGDLPTNGWMRWGYLHADHHLRQFGV